MRPIPGLPNIRRGSENAHTFRQAYISRASEDIPATELDRLEELSRIRSQRLGIKNLVVVVEGRVIQIMEGPEKVVRRIMKRIATDDHHHHLVNIFSSHANQTPLLKDPNLVIRNFNDVPADMMSRLRQLACKFQWACQNPELESSDIGFLKSLALFTFKNPVSGARG